MKFTPTLLDDIRSRVSIVSVVGRKVQWDRRKSNAGKGDMWACCPFHTEKSPSFHVEERKGRYHCFGCKVSGDVFTFLVEKEGLSFPEAVERLAEEAGIKIAPQTPAEVQREQTKLSLFDVMKKAQEFYSERLWSAEGASALQYLRQRGLDDEVIREFGLGYASQKRDALKQHLLGQRVDDTAMMEAGLLVAVESTDELIDRFRSRIMFPIHDQKGRTIAFGGRAMSPDAIAKYLNSPETPLFSKGKVLFNFHRARKSAFENGSALLVEGYLDVILLHQYGFKNSFAPLGTALTEEQAASVWKVVPEITLCLDGDSAGLSAAVRAFDRLLPKFTGSRSLRVAFLPDGQDPADLMQQDKKSIFVAVLEAAMSSSEFFWWKSTNGKPIDTPEQKSELERELMTQIQLIEDPVVKKHYSLQTRLQLASYFYQFDKTRLRQNPISKRVLPILHEPVNENIGELEKTVLGLVVQFPEHFADSARFFEMHFSNNAFNSFQMELIRLLVREQARSVASIYDRVNDEFVFVLQEVHGDIVYDRFNRVAKPRGHKLFARCPMAKYALPELFAIKLFEVFCSLSDRARVKIDLRLIKDALASDYTEAEIAKVQALFRELAGLEAHISVIEKELEDWASEIISEQRLRKVA